MLARHCCNATPQRLQCCLLPMLSQDELLRNRCPGKTLDVWRKGVDTNMFHPRYRSATMRERLSGGFPAAPILVYVGRLGAGVAMLSPATCTCCSCTFARALL